MSTLIGKLFFTKIPPDQSTCLYVANPLVCAHHKEVDPVKNGFLLGAKKQLATLGAVNDEDDLVFLAEAALGEMHRAHQPEQFPGAPSFSHSVYGVGKYKPCKEGIKDINNVDNNYELTENSKPTERILFNTGRLKQNPDLKEDPQQYENSKGLNYNEFVVYDNAQVKLRYAVLCEFEFQ